MRPVMFADWWMWAALTALALSGILIGLVGFLLVTFKKRPPALPGSLDELWHRYETGDITRWEYDRLRRLEGFRKSIDEVRGRLEESRRA